MIYQHRRLLCVPYNDQGKIDLEYDNNTENNIYINFPKKEYEYMMINTHIFDKINNECDLLIDDYEEDIIQYKDFEIVSRILENHVENIPIFMYAFNIAKKYRTYLEVVL